MQAVHAVVDRVRTNLFIGGEWRSGSDGAAIDVVDPATEKVIASVASATVDDGLEAVAIAEAAGKDWARRAPRDRAELLRRVFESMLDEADWLATLIALENGKTMADARSEVAYAAEFFRWFSEEAVRNIGSVSYAPAGGSRIVVMHQPIGVSLLVTPWNFPAAMATRKIAPALAAGCSVILKPASETPLTALAIGQLLERAGVPQGVVNVLPTRKTALFVRTLLNDDRVRKLSFTGSTEVGRVLLREAAESVVDCSMELGGNAPFIVYADADIDAAVEGAMIAKMRNGGQACTAANRFYVHRDVAEVFTERFTKAMADLVVGPGTEAGVDVGPLINGAAKEAMIETVERGLDAGASLTTGGAYDGVGYFYRPTVLRDVPADAPFLNSEIFGPVAPIVTFGPDDDVIALANDTEYGLAAYVYTRDLSRALRVSEALDYGMVGINRGIVSDPAAPFGGAKQSGVGREGGHIGMLEFTESKYVSVGWDSADA